MKGYTISYFFFCYLLSACMPLIAQSDSASSPTDFLIKSKGIPFIKNHTPKDYQASSQNWTITQDNRGMMYVGNNDGILEFDGLNWRLITTSNKSVVRSLAKDEKGRIYAGALGEVGYLAPDSLGKMEYKSLLPVIPKEERNFNNMWDIYIAKEAIYMMSFSGLYIFPKDVPKSKKKVKVIHPTKDQLFHRGFLVNEAMYVREWEKGLMKLNGDSLEMVPGGEFFANERIYGMVPFGSDKILIATRTKGLFIYDGKQLTPWRADLTAFLNKAEIYSARLLKNKYYLITTLNAGVLILDTQGNPVQLINQPKGLLSNSIYYSFLDRNQNLWLGGENGISMLQVGLPITIFDQRLGIDGGTNAIRQFNDKLYLATNPGLYSRSWGKQENILEGGANFELLKNGSGQSWDFIEFDNQLYVGRFNGVMNIQGTIARKTFQDQSHIVGFVPLKDNKVLVAGAEGLTLLSRKGLNWKQIKQYKSYKPTFDQHHVLLRDQEGLFWTSHQNVGVFSFQLDEATDSLINLKFYDAPKYGLPSNLQIRSYKVDNRIVLATEKGVFTFDKEQNKFKRDILDQYMPKGQRVFFLVQDFSGNIWFQVGDKIGVLQKNDSGEQKFLTNYSHFSPLKGAEVYCIVPLKSGEVMMGTSEGIIHYQGNLNKKYTSDFNTFINRVELETGLGRDSLIFAGMYRNVVGSVLSKQPQSAIKTFPFKLNSFRFGFSTPYYTLPKSILYSFYLEGFDQKWSAWADHKEKEYTNLSAGTYIFHLKARNVYGEISEEAIYTFIVKPPWYRTIWAYIGFTLLALLLLWGIIWLNTRRLRQQKEFLEQKVEERTTEIRNKNHILEEQKEEIISKNDALEIQKEEITAKNSALEQQKEEITNKNTELEQQKEEMIAQAEVLKTVNRELTHQKDEIQRQRDEIELQRDSIQFQKNEIEQQKDEIEEKKDEIERQRDVLEKTNEIIHRKNQDITSSIRYAQTIQQAILPFGQRMDQVLEDYFVIYRPKDIVSGDFYWLSSNIENKILMAAVDCTGHGVPGAFMSMIGYTLLNEIVNDQEITQPAQILEELHKLTRLALRQESQANADGMDLCLCMLEPIDAEQIQITFAGAKRPLYYVPQGGNELLEIKGNRKSIGGGKHFENPKFTQQAFAVPRGTTIYLTTDGMIDQNNEQRKKFGTVRFKELLQNCSALSLAEQKDRLNEALDQHQLGTDQRDDITVWAIKI
ncbi:hypothetical protein BKI52_09770 [marine bacterium AO1-C]|nr:hypothetical protein BKI52_09770 [marine bacterium AO1-C]